MPTTTASQAVFRQRPFVRLWIGTTASGLATWALPFALSLAVVEGDLSAGRLGLALAARTIGFLLALPVGGVLADRSSPRTVVAWSCGTAAVASLPLVVTGFSTAVLLTAAFVVGAGQGACRPAFQALVPASVSAVQRQEANAAITVAVRTCVLTGPTLASLLAVAVGTRWVLLVIGALWVLAATAPAWPPAGQPTYATAPDGRTGFFRDFADGVREARRHPWFLAGLGALAAVITTGYSVTAVALPLLSREQDGSAALLTAATTAYTAGALAGGLLVARRRPASPGWLALGGLSLYALAPLALAFAAPAVVVATYVAIGVGIEFFNVPWFTAAQREVPAERFSRVSSLDFLVSYGLAPAGLALITPAIDAFGLRPVLLGSAAVCLAGPLGAALVPSSRHFSSTIASLPK